MLSKDRDGSSAAKREAEYERNMSRIIAEYERSTSAYLPTFSDVYPYPYR